MNKFQQIAKNIGVMLISQILSYLLAFFYVIFAANYLNSEGFGVLSFALAFTGVFSILADLGINLVMSREISRKNEETGKYLKNVIFIKLFLATITLIVIFSLINLLGYPKETVQIVYIISFSTLLTTFYETFYFIFQSYEKMEYQSIGLIIYNTILFIGAIFAINSGLNIYFFAYNYLFASIIVLAYVILIFVRKIGYKQSEIDINFCKNLIIIAAPLSLFVISTTIINRVDTVLLSILKGNTVVGWYTASYRLMEALTVIPIVFMAAVYPIISRLYISSREILCITYKKSFKYLIILGLPIAPGTIILSPVIITYLYNSSYLPSILILQILIITIPIFYATYLLKMILISIDQQSLLSKLLIIVMVFNITSNIILIPIFSYIAAAIINVLTEAIFLVISYYYISNLICRIKVRKIIMKSLIGCLTMASFLLIFNVDLIYKIIFGIVIYFLTLICLKTFNEEDVYLFKKILNLNKSNREN